MIGRKPLAERFWGKVRKTPDCWLWMGSRNPSGYGLVGVTGDDGRHTTRGAHRVAWELLAGPIPAGLTIDHLCRVRHCVNPEHLALVTQRENVRRGDRATRTHCPQGHPLDGANLYIWQDKAGRTHRRCRACQRRRRREWRPKG